MSLLRLCLVTAVAILASATNVTLAVDQVSAPNAGLPALHECDSTSRDPVFFFKRGSALVSPYLLLGARPTLSGQLHPNEIREGISCLDKAIQLLPGYWQAFWFRGKAYQALGETRAACDSFQSAFALHPENPDVGRELVIAYLDLSEFREALPIAKNLVETRPKDAGLRANYALALVLDGQFAAAQGAIAEALRLDPTDDVTRTLKGRIDDVATGVRPKPKSVKELQR
jgi:tetratricopeptide (TPR) repeat protein